MVLAIEPDPDGDGGLMRPSRVMCILVLSAALVGCAVGCAPAPRFDAEVTLGAVTVRAYVADDAEEQSQGLQGYDALAPGEGMLFAYDDSAVRTFAMKGVTFPIDVVFGGEDLTVSAVEPLDPGDTRLVSSPGPCPYVLELPQGWAEEQGIGAGSGFEVARD